MDIKEVLSRTSIFKIFQNYGIKLIGRGNERTCVCPFHDDTDPSMSVNESKGCFFCFGCGAKGDVVDFVKLMENTNSFKRALEILSGKTQTTKIIRPPNKKPYELWKPCKTIPDSALSQLPKVIKEKPITHYHKYCDINGNCIGFTVRFIKDDGKKDMRPLSWRTYNGVYRWITKGFGWYLYGLEFLQQFPKSLVILVEGEKCKDVLHETIGSERCVVLGTSSTSWIDKIDFSNLKGRNIILWPDADTQVYPNTHHLIPMLKQPGMRAMLKIPKMVKASFRVVIPAEDKTDGWDCADAILNEGWGKKEIKDYFNKQLRGLDEFSNK